MTAGIQNLIGTQFRQRIDWLLLGIPWLFQSAFRECVAGRFVR